MDIAAWKQKLYISPLSVITLVCFVGVFVLFWSYAWYLSQKDLASQDILRREIEELRKKNLQLSDRNQELEQDIESLQVEDNETPPESGETTDSEVEVEQARDRSFVHEVKKGESPWDIAALYNVSVEDLLRWNNLTKRARIFPGDQLTIILEEEEETR
jgi:LysM repeat protein